VRPVLPPAQKTANEREALLGQKERSVAAAAKDADDQAAALRAREQALHKVTFNFYRGIIHKANAREICALAFGLVACLRFC
jgi:hypothetical protein